MISAFLSLIDRILQLLRLRASRKERLFTKLWKPTFEELSRVHTDYLEMLENCSSELEVIALHPENGKTQHQVTEIITTLRKGRLKYEPVRRHLLAIIDEAKHYDYSVAEENYVHALIEYFPTTLNRKVSTRAAETLTLLEALREVLISNEYEPKLVSDSVQETCSQVRAALQRMRAAWDNVCQSYSVLQNENARLDLG